jgi:rhodanese-related sulfurtransferase
MQEITPSALKARLSTADPPVVLDIPMNEVANRLAELPKDRDIVVMCRSGGRSSKVAQYLEQRGYRTANLTGGILRWTEDVDPTLETY